MPGVGRYDRPAEAQFINTYSPVPFDEIMQAGLAKQQQYETGLAGFEGAQAQAEQLQYIPGSLDERYISETVLPTFQELADEYATQDFSDPFVLREINKRIRGLDRQRISRIQKSAQAYGQYQQDLRKLGIQGKTASYLNRFDPSQFSSEFDIFNKTPEARLDYGKAAEGYFNQLRDTHLGFDQETGTMISGVTPGIVQNVANANLAEFMGTSEGNQAIRAMKQQGHPGSDSEIAYDVLVSRGTEFVRQNIGFAPQHATRQKDSIEIGDTAYTDLMSPLGVPDKTKTLKKRIKDVGDFGNFSTVYRDSEGKELGTLEVVGKKLSKWISKIDVTSVDTNDLIKTFEPTSPQDEDIYKAITTRARNYVGNKVYDNSSDKEKKKIIDQFLTDYQTEGKAIAQREIVDPNETKKLNRQFLAKNTDGNILAAQRQWYDPSDDTQSPRKTYAEATEDYPPSEYEYFISHELQPQNLAFSSGYTVTILDENKQPVKKLYMSGSKEEMISNNFEHNVYQSLFNNPTGLVEVNDPELGIRLKGFMESSNSGKFQVLDREGNTITTFRIENDNGINTDEVINNLLNSLQSVRQFN